LIASKRPAASATVRIAGIKKATENSIPRESTSPRMRPEYHPKIANVPASPLAITFDETKLHIKHPKAKPQRLKAVTVFDRV
jgi:hypothetical protein